jgi:hypothetical protein
MASHPTKHIYLQLVTAEAPTWAKSGVATVTLSSVSYPVPWDSLFNKRRLAFFSAVASRYAPKSVRLRNQQLRGISLGGLASVSGDEWDLKTSVGANITALLAAGYNTAGFLTTMKQLMRDVADLFYRQTALVLPFGSSHTLDDASNAYYMSEQLVAWGYQTWPDRFVAKRTDLSSTSTVFDTANTDIMTAYYRQGVAWKMAAAGASNANLDTAGDIGRAYEPSWIEYHQADLTDATLDTAWQNTMTGGYTRSVAKQLQVAQRGLNTTMLILAEWDLDIDASAALAKISKMFREPEVVVVMGAYRGSSSATTRTAIIARERQALDWCRAYFRPSQHLVRVLTDKDYGNPSDNSMIPTGGARQYVDIIEDIWPRYPIVSPSNTFTPQVGEGSGTFVQYKDGAGRCFPGMIFDIWVPELVAEYTSAEQFNSDHEDWFFRNFELSQPKWRFVMSQRLWHTSVGDGTLNWLHSDTTGDRGRRGLLRRAAYDRHTIIFDASLYSGGAHNQESVSMPSGRTYLVDEVNCPHFMTGGSLTDRVTPDPTLWSRGYRTGSGAKGAFTMVQANYERLEICFYSISGERLYSYVLEDA